MVTGQRERKREQLERTIRGCALDLFDAAGFDAVTVEQVAAAAGTSPSTVYRYFGTKEGLVVADEFDHLGAAELAAVLDVTDLPGSFERMVHRYETPAPISSLQDPPDEPRRRIRYFVEEPAVRAAVYLTLDRAADRIAIELRERGGHQPLVAEVIARAFTYGYFAALEHWYRTGASGPIAPAVRAGLDAIAPVAVPPGHPSHRLSHP